MSTVDAELYRQLNQKADKEALASEVVRAEQAEQTNAQAISALTQRIEDIENNEVVGSIIK